MADNSGDEDFVSSSQTLTTQAFLEHIISSVTRGAFDDYKNEVGNDTYDDGSVRWDGSTLYYFFKSRPKEISDKLEIEIKDKGFLNQFKRLHTEGISKRWAKLVFKLYGDVRAWSIEDTLREYVTYCDDIGYEPKAFVIFKDVVDQLKNNDRNSRQFQPSFDHSSQVSPVAKAEIERIKKYLDVYPYNKTRLTNPSKDKLSNALNDIDRLLETLPKNIDLSALKAAVLNGLGFLDDALSLSQSLYDVHSSHEAVAVAHVNCLYKSGEIDEALNVCSGHVRHQPKSFLVQINLAKIYQSKEWVHEAIEIYQRTIGLDGEFLSAYLQLGNVYGRIFALDRQEDILRKALVIAPDSFQVKSQLIANLVLQKKHSEMKELMLDISKSGNDLVNENILEAIEKFENGLFAEARNEIREWVNYIIDDPLVSRSAVALNLCHLGSMIDEKEMCREAREFQRECFLEALRICPDQELANAGLIGLEINSGEFHIARQEFFKVRDALQNQKKLRDFCDVVVQKIIDPDFKMLPFEWYVEEYPDDLNAHIHVGYFYLAFRREDKARNQLSVLRALFHSDENMLNGKARHEHYAFEYARIVFEFENIFRPEESGVYFVISICDRHIGENINECDQGLYIKFLGLHFDAMCLQASRRESEDGLIVAIKSGERYVRFIPKVSLFNQWRDASSKLSDLYFRLFKISGEAQHKDKSKGILNDIDKMAAFYAEGRD